MKMKKKKKCRESGVKDEYAVPGRSYKKKY
jgi:hypothetical protein